MKPTHLITLSARIEDLSGWHYNAKTELEGIKEQDQLLKQPVTLAHFVPCDKNGVPLEKLPKVIHSKEQLSLKYKHVMSEDSVIFDGWEVVRDEFYKESKTRVVRIKDQIGTELEFYYDENNKLENIDGVYNEKPFKYEYIQSLADLAEATTENPIKLK